MALVEGQHGLGSTSAARTCAQPPLVGAGSAEARQAHPLPRSLPSSGSPPRPVLLVVIFLVWHKLQMRETDAHECLGQAANSPPFPSSFWLACNQFF